MKFSQILDGMGDFSDLRDHDTAMKFWLTANPLPAANDWCEGKDVPLRQLSDGEKVLHDEVKTVSEWIDA